MMASSPGVPGGEGRSQNQTGASRPKIQRTPSRPTSALMALPPEPPKAVSTGARESPARDRHTHHAHQDCCGRTQHKRGGVVYGAARKQNTGSTTTASSASKSHPNDAASDPEEEAEQGVEGSLKRIQDPKYHLGTGKKFPFRKEAIGYLRFLQNQSNLLHTLQQMAEFDFSFAGQDGLDGAVRAMETSGAPTAADADADKNEAASATAVGPIDSNPFSITTESILETAGISMAEFDSYQPVRGKAPSMLGLRLTQCSTHNLLAPGLVLCQRLLEIEPGNKEYLDLYGVFMVRLKQQVFDSNVKEAVTSDNEDEDEEEDEDDDEDDDEKSESDDGDESDASSSDENSSEEDSSEEDSSEEDSSVEDSSEEDSSVEEEECTEDYLKNGSKYEGHLKTGSKYEDDLKSKFHESNVL